MFANQEQIITKAELMRVLMSNHMALSEKEVVKKAETVLAQCGDTEGVVSYDDYMKVARRFPNILFSSAVSPPRHAPLQLSPAPLCVTLTPLYHSHSLTPTLPVLQLYGTAAK